MKRMAKSRFSLVSEILVQTTSRHFSTRIFFVFFYQRLHIHFIYSIANKVALRAFEFFKFTFTKVEF